MLALYKPQPTFFCFNLGALDSGIVRLKLDLDRAFTVGKLGDWTSRASEIRRQQSVHGGKLSTSPVLRMTNLQSLKPISKYCLNFSKLTLVLVLELKALCHYIVPSVTKNSKSAILRAPQNGRKSLMSSHELVYAIAYSLVGISVIVNKQRVD